jgi:hypothetical protein
MAVALVICHAFAIGCGDSRRREQDSQRLAAYANGFEPCAADGNCLNLYATPDDVRKILEGHQVDEPYVRAVMLVLLKHYAHQLSEYHQGYEIRKPILHEQSAFVEAYTRIAGEFHGDYMTSGVAYEWVKMHPVYLHDPAIREQMTRIDHTSEEIERLFQTDLDERPVPE